MEMTGTAPPPLCGSALKNVEGSCGYNARIYSTFDLLIQLQNCLVDMLLVDSNLSISTADVLGFWSLIYFQKYRDSFNFRTDIEEEKIIIEVRRTI